ncbi:epoxyqueuosine reductase QueH, partial [bacterium]|nr:epoxyqueuosine reductase QueH [bacterium]
PYTGEEYSQKLEKRAFDREGGLRCRYCIALRMKDAFHYAFINHFDYFTSTMSMSRQKDEQMVNQLGLSFQTKYPWTKFIVHNFKKKGGQELGLALTKKYDLYQQLFCGCKFSRKT